MRSCYSFANALRIGYVEVARRGKDRSGQAASNLASPTFPEHVCLPVCLSHPDVVPITTVFELCVNRYQVNVQITTYLGGGTSPISHMTLVTGPESAREVTIVPPTSHYSV